MDRQAAACEESSKIARSIGRFGDRLGNRFSRRRRLLAAGATAAVVGVAGRT